MKVRVTNRAQGGMCWRIPAAILVFALALAPQLAVIGLVLAYRGYAQGLLNVHHISSWR